MALSGKGKGRREQGAPTRRAKTPNAVDTLVGEQTEACGDFHFAGGLHLDGSIKGQVIADSDGNAMLSISEGASIEGDVRVPYVVLNGSINGDVHASEQIALSAHARVNGNVYYKLIEMASGAVVNGHLIYEGEQVDAAPTAAPDPGSADDGDETSDGGFGVETAGT